MRALLITLTLAGLLAGCAPAEQPAAPAVDATSAVASATPLAGSSSSAGAAPMIVTVKPPILPVAPLAGASTPMPGWQTFQSAALRVAVDYPVDWTTKEQTAGVTFTSPDGATILLQLERNMQIAGSSSSAQTGSDCTTVTNSYGVTAALCFDKAASRYTALVQQPGDATAIWLRLSTVSQQRPAVFFQMFDTLRALD
jgi:hypothetical protein